MICIKVFVTVFILNNSSGCLMQASNLKLIVPSTNVLEVKEKYNVSVISITEEKEEYNIPATNVIEIKEGYDITAKDLMRPKVEFYIHSRNTNVGEEDYNSKASDIKMIEQENNLTTINTTGGKEESIIKVIDVTAKKEFNITNIEVKEEFYISAKEVVVTEKEYNTSTSDMAGIEKEYKDGVEMEEDYNNTSTTDVPMKEEDHYDSAPDETAIGEEYDILSKDEAEIEEDYNTSTKDVPIKEEDNHGSAPDETVIGEEYDMSSKDAAVMEEEYNISTTDVLVMEQEYNISGNEVPVIEEDVSTSYVTVIEENNGSSKNVPKKVEEIPSCNGDDFCDRPAYYPSKEILDLITNASSGLDNMFSSPINPTEEYEEDFGKGRGDVFGAADNVCPMFNFHIRPKVAVNTRGKFMFVVNAPDDQDQLKFVQVVETGQCMDTGAECMGAWHGIRTTECRQQFLEHKLVAVDVTLKEVIVDTFRFPSCCTCHLSPSLHL